MERRICAAEIEMLPVYRKALHVIPGDLPPAEPGEMFDPLRCVLELRHAGQHFGLARSLPLSYPGEVWACWSGGQQPSGLMVLADCPVLGPGPDGDACLLPNHHAGAHSWALTDPEEEALRARLGLG